MGQRSELPPFLGNRCQFATPSISARTPGRKKNTEKDCHQFTAVERRLIGGVPHRANGALSGIDTKMKTNPDSPPLTPAALLPYCRDCRDLSKWPERWMGEEKDLLPGRRIVAYFMPFLLHLTEAGLSKRTIQDHIDNMWLLGGEIIRDVNEEPRLRKRSAEQLVRNVIHEDGGPLIHNGWEDDQASFDSTCRKFHRFLTQSQR
ncbi:MAG TPA: hypothetical protein VN924_05585 [Bryobacteraceae bacterium]|nr:hypothetical protein [Bryobacteraceae bacterium]